MTDDRLLVLAGGHNFRDFGGYATIDGACVRRGLLFRSGMMSQVTSDDVAQLRALGIATVCDLRTVAERTQRPTRWASDSGEILADDAVAGTATLQALLTDDRATAAATRAAMVALYRELPFKHESMYRQLFRRLADGRVPVVINCSAGKDRTGVGAALVLRALGVSFELIERDFMMSNETIDLPRLLADTGFDRLMRDRPQIARAIMAVEPAFLAAAFDAIDTRCGSFDRYCADTLAASDDDLARMRASLLA